MFKKFFDDTFRSHYCNNGALIGGCYWPIEQAVDIIEDVVVGNAGQQAAAGQTQLQQGGPVSGASVPNSDTASAGKTTGQASAGGKQNLLGKTIKIIAENPTYAAYKDKTLVITKVATGKGDHWGYDDSMGGQALVDMETADTKEKVPFSLYEYEFKVL